MSKHSLSPSLALVENAFFPSWEIWWSPDTPVASSIFGLFSCFPSGLMFLFLHMVTNTIRSNTNRKHIQCNDGFECRQPLYMYLLLWHLWWTTLLYIIVGIILYLLSFRSSLCFQRTVLCYVEILAIPWCCWFNSRMSFLGWHTVFSDVPWQFSLSIFLCKRGDCLVSVLHRGYWFAHHLKQRLYTFALLCGKWQHFVVDCNF